MCYHGVEQRNGDNMSDGRKAEELRQHAYAVAEALRDSDVGGQCRHGGRHTCVTRQGRKPLPLYKVEEMCERCAAAWHAAMAATLLDSLVIVDSFIEAPMTPGPNTPSERPAASAVSIASLGPVALGMGALAVSRDFAKTRPDKPVPKPASRAVAAPSSAYTPAQKSRILDDYARLVTKDAKTAYLREHSITSKQVFGWKAARDAARKKRK